MNTRFSEMCLKNSKLAKEVSSDDNENVTNKSRQALILSRCLRYICWPRDNKRTKSSDGERRKKTQTNNVYFTKEAGRMRVGHFKKNQSI